MASRREIIQVTVASIAMGKIPRRYSEFGDLIWRVYELGRESKQLDVYASKKGEKEEDRDPVEVFREE